MTSAQERDRRIIVAIVWATSGFAFLLHVAVAGRYGFFRDELYFIMCGRHPAFGYVDQPPLIPLIAAGTQSFGHNLVLLRAVPALSSAAVVVVASLIARLAGGGRFAVALTGITVATAPMFVSNAGTLTTSCFEPLAWALVTYFAMRVVLLDDRRALLWAGVTIGLALEAKYEIPFYVVPLVAALLLTPQRRLLCTKEAAGAVFVAAALAAPSIVWQWQHGFPFVEVARSDGAGSAHASPFAFVLDQLEVMNVAFAPVWIAGVVASLVSPRFARLRFVGLAFVITFALMLALHAKNYYIAGLYPPAFALGGIAGETLLRGSSLRVSYVAFAVLVAVLRWPASLPLLSASQTSAYLGALFGRLPPASDGRWIPQNLADQRGWPELAQAVARVYVALPPAERRRAAILASNWGEAAALDFYGPALGLPRALSGHNQYYLWGTRGYDGSVVIRVNSDAVSYWRKHCRSSRVAGTFGSSRFVEPYERDRPIVVCLGFYRNLTDDWQEFKSFN